MIRLSLWLPLELIVVCNSDGVAVGGKGGVAQLLFFFYVCGDAQYPLHM